MQGLSHTLHLPLLLHHYSSLDQSYEEMVYQVMVDQVLKEHHMLPQY